MNLMSRGLLLLMLSAGLAFGQGVGSGGPSTVEPRQWPGQVWNEVFKEVDHSGTQVTNVLFNLVDEIPLWSFSEGKIKGKFKIERAVYDNQDVMSTWTVYDRFYFDLSRYGTEHTFEIAPKVTVPVNFNLGVGGKLMVTHVRQVPTSKYYEIPSTEEISKEIKKEEAEVLKRGPNRWYDFDPSIRPRIHAFYNPLLSIYRIPWTKEGLRKIGARQLMSWSASGYVNVGLESGLLPLNLHEKVDLSLGLGIQSYLKGEFRITLLKEDDRYVRVKLTKVSSIGAGVTAGAETSDIETYEGFLLFKGSGLETRLLEHDITVVPFKFGYDHEKKKQWDVGYRFDLEDPEAEEAFEKAMRGNFYFAEEVARTNPAVSSILTRESFERRKTMAYRLGLRWLIQGGRKREKKDLWITIERPEGKREIFKSSFHLSRSWTTLLRSGEKKDFTFTTIFDETAFAEGKDNSFQLISEALVEDVRTSGKEIQEYIRDVESVIGEIEGLPDLPLLVPGEDDQMKEAKYGRSSFYYGQYFSQDQVVKFLLTDSIKAREIAEKTFAHIKYRFTRRQLVRDFHKHWMRLQARYRESLEAHELIELLQDFRRLFKYSSSAPHAMRALPLALEGEDIDYFLTATNRSFGRVQFRGRNVTNAERLLQLADETVDFEGKVGNSRPNLDAQIKDFKVEVLSPQLIKVSFILPKDPDHLYFRIMRTSGWKRVKTLIDFIYLNNERFKEGFNEWTFGEGSTDRLGKELFAAFQKTDFYTFQVSSSPDKDKWGRIESSRFMYTAPVETENHE